ncbi:MAG TPA: CBS domain-containing protein [Sediminibacterium sp.]|nr:CBS domain-containing protein [Sediminibacterium sp.]
MLTGQLSHTGFPTVGLSDKTGLALQLMEEYDVQHIPVVADDKLLGLLGKDDLLDADEQMPLAGMETALLPVSVKSEAHITLAVKLMASNDLSLLPVTNEQGEYSGVITTTSLIQAVSRYLGNEEPGGIIVLETDKRHYYFGEISRLVETHDAFITQLNTYPDTERGTVTIALKINRTEISDIIASFQRYEYQVLYYFGEEAYDNELKENYRHLLSYLNI